MVWEGTLRGNDGGKQNLPEATNTPGEDGARRSSERRHRLLGGLVAEPSVFKNFFKLQPIPGGSVDRTSVSPGSWGERSCWPPGVSIARRHADGSTWTSVSRGFAGIRSDMFSAIGLPGGGPGGREPPPGKTRRVPGAGAPPVNVRGGGSTPVKNPGWSGEGESSPREETGGSGGAGSAPGWAQRPHKRKRKS
jgi:hypothetical protein